MNKPRDLLVRQLFPIPDVPAPAKLRCISLYIPDNMDHLAIFAGAIALLGKWNSWSKDEAHSARLCAMAWQQALYLGIRDCETGESIDGVILEDDMGDNIRVDPDNSCIIQIKCCVPDALSQPTDGTALTAGECREWDVSLRGNEKWLLPVAVNANDTISVTAAAGAWNDGTLGWNCVDGHTYALGACVSADPAVGGDPLMTVDHMRLIMSVDGTFTDAYNVLYAVPSGVIDGQVFFQANDSALDDNSGAVSFHLKVCAAVAEASAVGLTYDYGSGPASITLNPGEERVITFTGTAIAGYVNNYGVNIHFSTPVVITVLTQTGYVNVSSGVVFSAIYNPYPTVVHTLTNPPDLNLTDMPPALTGDLYGGATGSGGAPFTVTLKLSLP
jgi:hypothetical protein